MLMIIVKMVNTWIRKFYKNSKLLKKKMNTSAAVGLVQRFVVAIKVKQKDDRHVVPAVVTLVVVAVLAGIVSSKIAIIIFLYVCIIR